MDIEELTKSELIIAALLVSFATALLTGIVVIYLSEDAPEDVIRVSERVVSSSTSSSDQEATAISSSTSSEDMALGGDATKSRDEIISATVKAVARVTSGSTQPQAGVLLEGPTTPIVITGAADYTSEIQALFKEGTVAELSNSTQTPYQFSVLLVQGADGQIHPLSTSRNVPSPDDTLFVVPLTAQPQIVETSMTSIEENIIHTSSGSLPTGSVLLNTRGEVEGLFRAESGGFIPISTLTR